MVCVFLSNIWQRYTFFCYSTGFRRKSSIFYKEKREKHRKNEESNGQDGYTEQQVH